MFSQEVLDIVGQVGGDIVVQLAVTSLPQCRLLFQLVDSFNVLVLLVTSLTIWCIHLVNNIFLGD